MAGLDDIVQMTLTTETQQISRAGFGTPLILGCSNRFAELTRSYSKPSDMTADGFATTDPEYLAAQAVCSQNPKPPTFKVARRDNKPTISFKWTPLAKNSTKYTLVVDGQTCEFTSDANATVAEIVAGMRAAVVAKSISGLTITDNTTHLTIVATAAGAWHTVVMSLRDIASGHGNIEQNHADGGIATDLAAIVLYDPDWYALILASGSSKAEIVAAAAWVEAAKKLMVVASQDSAIITAAAGGTDVAQALATAGYARTGVIYHPKAAQFAGAALQGRCLPLDPGSETWMFKTLNGVDVCTELTPTHCTNAKAKFANIYPRIGGVGCTEWGFVAANEWIDIIRFRDWLQARMQERVFGTLVNAEKVPFTDKGIAVIEKDVRAQLDEGVEAGGLEGTYTVGVPARADVSSVNVAARRLPDVEFSAVLAGSIHELVITGTLTY